MTIVARRDLHGGRCPRCGHELLVLELEDLGVEGCVRCGGLWLDGDSSDRVLESIHAGALTVAAAASASAIEAVDTSAACACPRCRLPMRTVVVAGPDVELDRCDAHGTWFDRDELQKVSRAAAEARSRAGVGEAANAGVDPVAATALAEVAAGHAGSGLEVALDALAAIFDRS
jgi:Zn-finger nucleic acid-binding protein